MNIDLIIDLQFGSTGKGLLAGKLAMTNRYDTIMTAWGPNAGHTYIDENGRKFVHIMLANGIVGPAVRRVMIGPGSVLDLDILQREVESCLDIIARNKISIFVHPHAAVVTNQNRADEQIKMTAIGSTKKGVGAAMCSKIERQPNRPTVARDFADHPVFGGGHEDCPVVIVDSPMDWNDILIEQCNQVLIEGAQGFGLSMQHGFYPYTTSRDVTPLQIMADCGVSFNDARRAMVFGTARTYPIRVADRFDDTGKQVGTSGPCYPDQQELAWSDLGQEPELTTVTKLPRRIFTYSKMQMDFAFDICCPTTVFLNFVNYIKDRRLFCEVNDHIMGRVGGCVIYGTGPTIKNVHSQLWGNSHKRWNDLCLIMEKGMA